MAQEDMWVSEPQIILIGNVIIPWNQIQLYNGLRFCTDQSNITQIDHVYIHIVFIFFKFWDKTL